MVIKNGLQFSNPSSGGSCLRRLFGALFRLCGAHNQLSNPPSFVRLFEMHCKVAHRLRHAGFFFALKKSRFRRGNLELRPFLLVVNWKWFNTAYMCSSMASTRVTVLRIQYCKRQTKWTGKSWGGRGGWIVRRNRLFSLRWVCILKICFSEVKKFSKHVRSYLVL